VTTTLERRVPSLPWQDVLTAGRGLGRVCFPFNNMQTLDDGLPRRARADVIPESLKEPQGKPLTLLVGAG